MDVLTSIQSRVAAGSAGGADDRVARGLGLREMMRRASSAARAVSGLDVRESPADQGSGSSEQIPTLSWPPDAPPTFDTSLSQRKYGEQCVNSQFLLFFKECGVSQP